MADLFDGEVEPISFNIAEFSESFYSKVNNGAKTDVEIEERTLSNN